MYRIFIVIWAAAASGVLCLADSAAPMSGVARLAAGVVKVRYEDGGESVARGNGMTNEIRLAEVPIPAGSNYVDVVKGVSVTGRVTMVSVADTPYQFMLLDGAPQPFFYESERRQLWRLQGLEKWRLESLDGVFSRCRWIIPGSRRITFGGVDRLHDLYLFWTFDFGNPTSGLIISFSATGGF